MKQPGPTPQDESQVPGDLRRVALTLAAIWALLFSPQLFGTRIFVVGDTASIRAFAEFSGERWRTHHERTHWNPYIFAGLPSTASLQDSRPQWLPDLLLEGFDRLHRLPGFPPLAIPLLVHLGGMIAMAALARSLWKAGTLAMLWSGLAWGLLPGQLVPLAFGQDWLVMSSSLMPVVLLAVVHVTSAETTTDRLSAGLGLSLATAFLFLAAHPQIIALTLPIAALFAVERMRAGDRIAASGRLALFAVLGVAMAAAMWWPAALYTGHTVRGGGGGTGGMSFGEIGAWSAGPVDLIALVWPWAAGFGGATYWGGLQATDFPQFIGTTVFALGLVGLAGRGANTRAAALLAVLAAGSAAFALGLHLGGVWQWMHDHVPLWSSFRVAIRTLIVTALAGVLLSARGLEHLVRATPKSYSRWIRNAGAVAGVALVLAALLRWGFLADPYAGAVQRARPRMEAPAARDVARRAALDLGWRALLLAALSAALALRSRAAARWRAPVVLGLLALDLGTVSVPFLRDATGPLGRITHPGMPEIARRAALEPTARVLDLGRGRLFSNDWIRWRARSLTGNHPAVPREWDDLWRSQAAHAYPALCALAVRYMGGIEGSTPDTNLVDVIAGSPGEGPVWRLKGALPRAHAVSELVRRPDDRSVLEALAAPDFNPERVAFTTEDGIAGAFPGSPGCRVRWRVDDPDRQEIETSADAPAFLVIADTWFPGWRATLDGHALPIHRVDQMLRGLPIPPGVHRLQLRFEPEGWDAGVHWTRAAWCLWLSAALLLVALRFGQWRARGSLPIRA